VSLGFSCFFASHRSDIMKASASIRLAAALLLGAASAQTFQRLGTCPTLGTNFPVQQPQLMDYMLTKLQDAFSLQTSKPTDRVRDLEEHRKLTMISEPTSSLDSSLTSGSKFTRLSTGPRPMAFCLTRPSLLTLQRRARRAYPRPSTST
jgi:hypothetical protein